ncbi:MAG: hypothetical protein ABI112_07675 [Terracoccus sp.]
MSVMAVYFHGDDQFDVPDDTSWIPGEVGEPHELHGDVALHIQLERSLVYPNGVLVSLTVRAPIGGSREAQRSFARAVVSFHGTGNSGPRLDRWSDDQQEWVATMPWAHGGSGGHYSLPFWVAGAQTKPPALILRFTWPDRSLSSEFRYTAEQIREARSRAQRLFGRGAELEP